MNGWSLPEVPSPEMRMIMLRMLVVVTRWFHVGGKDDNDDDDEQLVPAREVLYIEMMVVISMVVMTMMLVLTMMVLMVTMTMTINGWSLPERCDPLWGKMHPLLFFAAPFWGIQTGSET